MLISSAFPAYSADPPRARGTYTNFFLPSLGVDITRVEYKVQIDTLPTNANLFYANQFGLRDEGAGYIGLQEKGSRVNGTTGETAVFSIFGIAQAANPSQNCHLDNSGNFDGYSDLNGTSC